MTVEALRSQLLEMYRDITESVLEDVAEGEEMAMVLQALFEALSHEAAFIEGKAVLLHVESSGFDQSRRLCRRVGLSECLSEHDKDCSGCDGSVALRKLVEAD